jgi:nitrilase
MNSKKDVDANLKEAEQFIERAVQKGVKLVVLPEMFACLGVSNQHEVATSRFTEEDVLATLSAWSHRFKIYLVAGSMPMTNLDQSESSQKVHAACLVFSPEGKQIANYNKIHLFDVDVEDEKGSYKESDTFIAGSAPEIAQIDDLKLGLTICYDLRFPELFQHYMAQGCQLMTVPSAFTYETGKAHWEILLRARAIETQSFILAANQVGVHEDGRRTWGHSMIIDPNGEILARVTGEEPGLAIAELDIKRLLTRRKAMPLLQHKRLN